ncbi:MAG: helicase-related protein [Thermoflexales bacterium]
MSIQPEDILEGDFWPEAVRVLKLEQRGSRLSIEAIGVQTKQYYPCLLGPADLAKVQVRPKQALTFAGGAEGFFLAIEAHRIRIAHQFDPLFAVNVSQVDPLPHQIEAVYHYILRQPRVRFLLADDPGAGKTIMAGLLLKELKYRGLVRRALIVAPAQLKDQWQREMKERFGEAFTIVDRPTMNAQWGRNVWQEEFQVITAIDFAKRDDVRAALAESFWDLVIVDEAHKMAAYRYGDKTDKTARYRLGELLSRISQHMLLLTATPHRGDPENFRLFLDLLAPGMFANIELLAESAQARDNPLFLRRLKEDLRDFEGRPLFPPRRVFTRAYRLNDDEKRLYNAVTEYVEKTYNKALEREKRNVAFALLILQRRMASSVRAVRRSLERRKARLDELLQLGQWLAEGARVDEDALEDAPEAERLEQEQQLLERLTAAETRDELAEEIDKLDQLIRLAREAERREIETKLAELRQVMEDERIKQSGEKLLIFTESRETLEYLSDKLREWGYSVVTLHGGMNLDARIQAEHDFRERAQVMISTEAGGEGINLQFCALMVNYDIPWNPNRLEQRMGRIHRYGQQKEAHIYNLVAGDTREGRVLKTLFEKLERIQQALGSDRVFDVIGEVVRGGSLKDLIVAAIAQRRALDEIVAQIQAISDEEIKNMTRQATMEALATRHIDLQRVLGEDRRARENRLVPEYVERFFERACRYLNVGLERRRDGLWRAPSVPAELRNVSAEFARQYGKVFHEYHKLAFDKQTARSQGAVFIAPGHPLLECVIEALFTRCQTDLQVGASFADPDGRLDGWLWFLRGELRDGNDSVAGQRVFAVFQPADGGPLRVVNSSILWDLTPWAGPPPTDPPPDEADAVAFAVDHILEPYKAELLQARRREAALKAKYGLSSLERLIRESEAKLLEYEERRAAGDPMPDVEINNERRRREDYEERKRKLEEEIRRQQSLLALAPSVLGVARVMPQPTPDAAMRADADIERIGMQAAMAHERANGRAPQDVSAENLGYDIRSTAPDGATRYIEVKARAASGSIALTPNEWMMAQRLGEEYWLYVVEHAGSAPRLHLIQNPAAKLQPQEVKEVVRYVIADWKRQADDGG